MQEGKTKYQVMPPLTAEEYEALKADIAENGVLVPVEYDEDGNILDGYHRAKICEELGINDFPFLVRQGMSEEEKIEHAIRLNCNRRHLSREQKQEKAAELRQQGWSYRRIAGVLGVVEGTIRYWLPETDAQNYAPATVTGIDGKEYPAIREKQQQPDEVKAEEAPAMPETEPIAPEVAFLEPTFPITSTSTAITPEPASLNVHYTSETDEWYTPQEIINRVLEVFPVIDLDPCSNSHTDPNIPAGKHYTEADDGLSQPWHGRVYMNPPYGREVKDWIDKLLQSLKNGNVSEAIVLVAARTDTKWFRKIMEFPASVIWCAVEGRLSFSDSKNSAPFPSAVIFLTQEQGREQDFYWAFCDVGLIYRQIGDGEMMQG